VTSRQRKHQRGKKNAAYQCQTKPIETKIRFNKIKHAPHQNFTHHASQSRFNAIAIAIAAKSNSGIRLQFVNNMHNSSKKRNFKAIQNQRRKSKLNAPITTNNRDEKTSTASPSILILFTIIEFEIKQIKRDCNSQYIIYESSRHLQRKEGDGYMQQIIKLKFSCNFINQNARPLQTIQHKMQNPFNQIIAIPSTTSKYSKRPRISP
jgi:hypothetical protein